VRRVTRAATAIGPASLYAVRASSVWRFLLTQPASYWLTCAYLFFEYVRPQSIYEWMDVFPWTLTTIILAITAFLFEGFKLRKWTVADTCLGVYTAIVLVSCVTAQYPSVSLENVDLYLSWVLIYFIITNVVTTEGRFLVFMLSFLLYNLKMSQHATLSWAAIGFSFRDWGATGGPGWFQNSGEFGIQMTIFFPLCLHFGLALFKHWPTWKRVAYLALPITALTGTLASSSRGAQLGIAAVTLWFFLHSRRRGLSLFLIIVGGALLLAILPAEQMGRFRESGTDYTSQLRLQYWKDGIEITNDFPATGIGYANWIPYYRSRYMERGQLPHNIFIEASSELGYPGFLGFVAMILSTFAVNRATRKLATGRHGRNEFIYRMALGLDASLIGFLVSGFFVTVLYYPYFWINLAMTVSLHTAARSGVSPAVVADPAVASPAPRLFRMRRRSA
jgi:putative inorganic carbon (HCO3(-)) transporter